MPECLMGVYLMEAYQTGLYRIRRMAGSLTGAYRSSACLPGVFRRVLPRTG
jgi:hypothetical protein